MLVLAAAAFLATSSSWAAPRTQDSPLAVAEPAASDEAIELAVEDRIRRDGVLRLAPLQIDCQVGVVTLTGEVDHLLAKDRAGDVARTVRGVRAVVNRILVDPHEERTDDHIAEHVRQALLADPATESYDVDVASLDGVVTLTGVVQSRAEKELSTDVARTVAGVRDVVDRIVVEEQEARPDEEIVAEIERLLASDVRVEGIGVEVSVREGAVTLSGSVPTLATKDRVETMAWTRGVTRVDGSALAVAPERFESATRPPATPSLTDDEVERAIADALLFDPRVAENTVTATVRDGIAYLRGSVGSLAARRSAADVAFGTRGVRRVKNYLIVRPAVDVSDDTIRDRIELAFGADPWLANQELRPDVVRGVVRLEGTIPAEAVRRRAIDVASRIGGVRLVDDRLALRTRAGRIPTDAELEEDVESELYWSPYVDSQGIEVEVTDGIVTLTGVARSWAESRAAERNAREAGARHVRNRLTVGHSPVRAPVRAPIDEG